VLRAEVYRLARSTSTWVAAGILLVVPALRVVAARAGGTASRVGRADGAGEFDSGNGWAPWVEGWRAGLALGTLMLLIHAARGLAGDRDSGLLRLAVTRSASRGGAVLGRALLAPVLVPAVVVLTGLGALAAAATFHDFGPLVEDGYTILTAEELGAALRSAALATLPPLFATYAFGLLVSSAARSAVGGVTLAVGGFLAFDLLRWRWGASWPATSSRTRSARRSTGSSRPTRRRSSTARRCTRWSASRTDTVTPARRTSCSP
jgi:hypothetical protein